MHFKAFGEAYFELQHLFEEVIVLSEYCYVIRVFFQVHVKLPEAIDCYSLHPIAELLC